MRFSYWQKVIITEIVGAPFLFCVANQFFKWHLLGGYDLVALTVSGAVIIPVLLFFTPTRQERLDYLKGRKK